VVEGIHLVKQVLVRDGHAVVEEVPAPVVGERSVLVRVAYSCVSPGTETARLRLSGMPLYRRALAQRDHAKRALDVGRDQGFIRTYKRARNQLSAGLPLGYSAAGTVIETGAEVTGCAVGDHVACAGAGIANHAEVIDVPVNLAVKVPSGLSSADASTVTLGAIALQGIRRTNPTLGETVGVIGLGIVGQLTAQLLVANGCRVVGSDRDGDRVRLAVENGMTHGVFPAENFVERAHNLTDGYGADAVIIAAATSSNEVVRQAMQACRRKGRVVVVGDVGLHLQRADFYEKELDLLISTSYGPGRYDDVYELEGRDYPLPYVRWTENRNMEEYLHLLAAGQVSLAELDAQTYEVEDADEAYAAFDGDRPAPLLVLFEYPVRHENVERKLPIRRVAAKTGRVRVAVAGAGSFAQGTHIPNLLKLNDSFELRSVMSRTGSNAASVAKRHGAAYATTEYEEVLADDEVDLVLIATRHHLHAEMTLRALEAGKNVFVEKPLALNSEELDRIEAFYETHEGPVLMTGFNRRFSPAAVRAKKALLGRTTPLVANYRMNAGYIPRDHWVHGPEGGGRNVGEACHIYDLFDYLVEAGVKDVSARSIEPSSDRWARNDNFVATVVYGDGSICTLSYTALGHDRHPKERLEIYADGHVLSLEDYKSLSTAGDNRTRWRSFRGPAKGHLEELGALAESLLGGEPWPIPLEEQLEAMRIAFQVELQLGPRLRQTDTRADAPRLQPDLD
jgi:predicted dehydrogenase/threonine dehydrogenase-like Zn-dependent dehydrogenase